MPLILNHNSRYYAVDDKVGIVGTLLGLTNEQILSTAQSHWAVLSYTCQHCPASHHMILVSWRSNEQTRWANLVDEQDGLTPCQSQAIAEALWDKLTTEAPSQ